MDPSRKAPSVSGTIIEKIVRALLVFFAAINYIIQFESVNESKFTYISERKLENEKWKNVAQKIDETVVTLLGRITDLQKTLKAFFEVVFNELSEADLVWIWHLGVLTVVLVLFGNLKHKGSEQDTNDELGNRNSEIELLLIQGLTSYDRFFEWMWDYIKQWAKEKEEGIVHVIFVLV